MNERQSLLDGYTTTSDDETNFKREKSLINKDTSIGLRQLVTILPICAMLLVLHYCSFVMLIELII